MQLSQLMAYNVDCVGRRYGASYIKNYAAKLRGQLIVFGTRDSNNKVRRASCAVRNSFT